MDKSKIKPTIQPADPLPQRNYTDVSPKFGGKFPHM